MTNEDLTTIANVGPEKADRLREAGFETVDDVKEASFMSNLATTTRTPTDCLCVATVEAEHN